MLISYHYFRTSDIGAILDEKFPNDPPPEVFADSGAFSAMTQGAPVDVHEYGKWITAHRDHFCLIANLDVIGADDDSARGTWQNQRILEDTYGLEVLPVFHAGEPWTVLDALLEREYAYIALGGLVGRTVKSIMPWLVRCFQLADGRAVFHGFGLTSWAPMAELPWYSVDSSSWGSGYRYGMVRLYDRKKRRLVQIGVSRGRREAFDHAALIREHGFAPADLTGHDDEGHVNRQLLNKLSSVGWRRVEAGLRERHGMIRIPGRPDSPPGLRLYLADSAIRDLAVAAHHHNLIQGVAS